MKEIITTWRREWEVRLELEVTKKSNESLTNIVHFTTGDTVWIIWVSDKTISHMSHYNMPGPESERLPRVDVETSDQEPQLQLVINTDQLSDIRHESLIMINNIYLFRWNLTLNTKLKVVITQSKHIDKV